MILLFILSDEHVLDLFKVRVDDPDVVALLSHLFLDVIFLLE